MVWFYLAIVASEILSVCRHFAISSWGSAPENMFEDNKSLNVCKLTQWLIYNGCHIHFTRMWKVPPPSQNPYACPDWWNYMPSLYFSLALHKIFLRHRHLYLTWIDRKGERWGGVTCSIGLLARFEPGSTALRGMSSNYSTTCAPQISMMIHSYSIFIRPVCKMYQWYNSYRCFRLHVMSLPVELL